MPVFLWRATDVEKCYCLRREQYNLVPQPKKKIFALLPLTELHTSYARSRPRKPRRHKNNTNKKKMWNRPVWRIKTPAYFAAQLVGITLTPVHKVNTNEICSEAPDLYYQRAQVEGSKISPSCYVKKPEMHSILYNIHHFQRRWQSGKNITIVLFYTLIDGLEITNDSTRGRVCKRKNLKYTFVNQTIIQGICCPIK